MGSVKMISVKQSFPKGIFTPPRFSKIPNQEEIVILIVYILDFAVNGEFLDSLSRTL